MAQIISIHSFRGGTGKSNTTANLATMLASKGERVCVIDTDIQSPGIHILFGLAGDDLASSLNDFLWHGHAIEDVAIDVTPNEINEKGGTIFLVPSSVKPGEITRVLREGYDARHLTEGLRQLVVELKLDTLLIDTHPGLNEETLLSLVISNTSIIVLRPDQQDYEGTGITTRVAQELNVPRIFLIVNKAPERFNHDEIKQKVEKAYDCNVAAILPHSDEMMELGSEGIFSLIYPSHPISELYREIATQLA